MAQKTIFVSVYDGDTEKVILRSGVLAALDTSGHRIVLLIRGEKRLTYYREHFERGNVFVELLPRAMNRWEDFWHHVSWNTVPTYAVYIRRRMRFQKEGGYLRYYFEAGLWALGHIRIWRNVLRFVYGSIREDFAADLFEKYQPDLLFSPNMFSPEDCRLLRAARQRKVRTVATAKSWDVLTTKAFTRVKADRLLVFNAFNKEEAVALGDYAPEDVIVTGFPQFDVYSKAPSMSREVFMKALGIPVEKRLILFGVPGDWMAPHVHEILVALDKKISEGALPPETHILARLHPKYQDTSEGLVLPHVTFERPGTHFTTGKEFSVDLGISGTYTWTFTDEDIQHLQASIVYSEAVLNVASTMTLDAVANDRPAVFVAYDGDAELPYWQSIGRYYERDHIVHVMETGAVPLVHSHDELTEVLNGILSGEKTRQEERQVLKDKLLYRVDGQASQRTASAILSLMK